MKDYIIDRDKMLHILQDIAACRTFDEYDPKECTEEVYEWGKALVDTARQAIDLAQDVFPNLSTLERENRCWYGDE